jgi:hypothetical protein
MQETHFIHVVKANDLHDLLITTEDGLNPFAQNAYAATVVACPSVGP